MSKLKTLFAASMLATSVVPCVNAEEKPNVLFLVVDDLKPFLGCYGKEQIKTPNLDKLSARGTLFENAYCQYAVCCPSRSSMLLGLRPDATNIYTLNKTFRQIRPDAITLFETFKNAGYETAGRGKVFHEFWMVDKPSWSTPYIIQMKYQNKEFGAPTFLGYQEPEHKKKIEEHIASYVKENGKYNYNAISKILSDAQLLKHFEAVDGPDDIYVDGQIAIEGVNLIDRLKDKSKPFLIALGFNKPHLPFNAPKKYYDLYDIDKIELAPNREESTLKFAQIKNGELSQKYAKVENFNDDYERELTRAYYACISYIDAQIGKVLDELEKNQLFDNTIIVVCSDHGFHLGDNAIWGKHTNFEQATKVPLLIYAPKLPSAQKSQALVELVDIYPTLTDLAGLEAPEYVQGKSLVPILKDSNATVKEFAMSQYLRHKIMGYSLRDKQYRYTVWLKADKKSFDEIVVTDVIAGELYDHNVDPYEAKNLFLSKDSKAVKAAMWKKMQTFFAESAKHNQKYPFGQPLIQK